MNIKVKFQLAGCKYNSGLSYAIEIIVPSFNSAIITRVNTGKAEVLGMLSQLLLSEQLN